MMGSRPRSLNAATVVHSCSSAAAFVIAVVLALVGTSGAQGLQWMHLVAPNVGWVASSASLFWTTDNGEHWRDITPPRPMADEKIAAVYFLDTSTGWVLLSHYEEPQPRFDLAITRDSGATWSVDQLQLPVEPHYPTLVTQGYIQFMDGAHGWMNLSIESSSAYHAGLLFRTVDGGKNWSLSKGPGTTGELRFIDGQNGWLLSPGGRELWVTHDGAATWSQVVLRPPAGTRPSNVAQYQLPLFWDDKHGLAVVRFHAFPAAPDADAQGSQLVLFTTADGGKSWKFDRPLSHLPTAGKSFATALADSTLLTAHPTGKNLTLRRIPLKDRVESAVEGASAGSSAVISISFADGQRGWSLTTVGNCSVGVLPCTHVLSTVDAGATWTDITPGRSAGESPAAPSGKPIRTAWQRAGTLRQLSADELSIHLGFDSCDLYDVAQMQDLWSGSSYQDVGFYMGDFEHINCDAPSQSYVSCIQGGEGCEGQAWGMMPLWSALQAPGACCSTVTGCPKPQNQMSSDPPTAMLQGMDAAMDTITTLQNLGLSGDIAYLDLEQYNNGPGSPAYCLTAPRAYVSGWVSTLHANGQLAGVYGSPTDAWTWTQNPPDDVWFGKSDQRVTIWKMGYGTGDNLWPNNQRIHQFWQLTSITLKDGDHYTLDRDVEDATIISNNNSLSKQLTFTPQIKSYIPCQTGWQGINNYGSLAGFTGTDPASTQALLDYFINGADNYVSISIQGDTDTGMTSIDNQQSPSPTPNEAVGSASSNPPFFVIKGQQPVAFSCAGATYTELLGTNDDLQFAGYLYDGTTWFGFVSPDATGQNCHTFAPTGALATNAVGINGDGQVVGSFFAADGTDHGFIYNYGNGINPPAPMQFDFPGAAVTLLYGISNNGWILGDAGFSDGTDVYFLYDENSGIMITLNNLPASYYLLGMNDNAQLAGGSGEYVPPCYTDGLILNTGLVP